MLKFSRKKKCHEQYPVCSHCLRLNLVCRWEGPREVTVGTESFKSTSSVSSANSSLSSGPHLVDFNQLGVYALPKYGPSPCGWAGEDDLISSRRMMLRYYTTSLVFMLTNNLHNNCFLSGMFQSEYCEFDINVGQSCYQWPLNAPR